MKNLSNNSTRMYEYDPQVNNEEVLFVKADITSLIIICIIIYVVIYYIFVYKLYVFDQNIKTKSEMNQNNEYNMYLNSADVLLVLLILYGMYRINLLDIDITSKAFYYDISSRSFL
jgi:heme/copper-type cytochrome/quinol oxidase subunit 2